MVGIRNPLPALIASLPALTAGAMGYGLFVIAGLPLPALLGPLAACAILSALRPQSFSEPLKNGGLVLLGLAIGATLTPDAVAVLLSLPLVALILAGTTAGAMAAGYAVYRRVGGWNRETSFLAAAPGALSTVIALMDTRDSRVSMSTVTLAQTLRLAALVTLFPLSFPKGTLAMPPQLWAVSDAAVALLVGVIAAGVLHWRRAPAAWILGPAASLALLTASGTLTGQPPIWLVDMGLALLGCAVGCKLGQVRDPGWKRHLAVICLAFAAMMAVSVLGVAVAHWGLGISWLTGFLLFAPGGFEAMIAIAVAFDIDPALVGAAHVARILGLTLVLPLLWRLVVGQKPAISKE